MNHKHTPGPWIVNDWSSSGRSVRSKIGMHIASKRWGNDLTGQEYRDEMISNAHLIAAAPDMLDALQSLLSYFERPSDWCDVDPVDVIKTAIAKARGKLTDEQ